MPSPPQGPLATARVRLLVVVLVAFCVIGLRWLPLEEWLDSLTAWGESTGAPGALLVGLLFVPVCLLMLPASSALAYAMALAFGLWASFAGVMFGAVLGAMACFLGGASLLGISSSDTSRAVPCWPPWTQCSTSAPLA